MAATSDSPQYYKFQLIGRNEIKNALMVLDFKPYTIKWTKHNNDKTELHGQSKVVNTKYEEHEPC